MGCPVGVGDGVYLQVKDGLREVDGIANAAIDQASKVADAITNLLEKVKPVLDDIELASAGQLSTPFQMTGRPEAPGETDIVQPALGYDPEINKVEYKRTVTFPGDFTKSAPGLNLPNQPGALTATAPIGVPVVTERAMPVSPSDQIPSVPTLFPLTLPALPALTLPSFSDLAPSNLPEIGISPFSWTEINYTQVMLPDVQAQIRAILGGSTGIPDQVWDMIWARARRQVLRQSRKGRDEAITQWASRGFFMPSGFLEQKLQEVQDQEVDQIGELTREQAIQDSKIYVERLNNAIVQGISLEGTLIGLYQGQAQRKLEAARITVEMAVAAARLRVDVYNAQMAGWHTKAQVALAQMQVELGKLEKTKVELEIQRLVGTLNQQELELYKTELQGIITKYDLYKTQIMAVAEQYDVDKLRIQAFGEQVSIFKALVDAKTAEWNGYGEAVKGESLKMENFRTETSAYLARVQAYGEGVRADTAEVDAKVRSEQLKIDRLRIEIDKFRALLSSEQVRVESLARVFEAEVRAWGTEGEVERSRVLSDTTRFETLLRNAQIKAQISLDNLKLKIESAKDMNNFQLAGLEAVLRAATQVGASALSALNYAAHVTAGFTSGTGCTDSYSHEE